MGGGGRMTWSISAGSLAQFLPPPPRPDSLSHTSRTQLQSQQTSAVHSDQGESSNLPRARHSFPHRHAPELAGPITSPPLVLPLFQGPY